MKRTILSLLVTLALVFAISSCGGKSVEMSAEMQEFVGMIKGSSADVSSALTKFGATEEIVENDMSMYDLKDPKVTAKEGDCYTAEFAAGITTRIYEICWQEGKIVSITEKGMK
jgi:hypothetical protein